MIPELTASRSADLTWSSVSLRTSMRLEGVPAQGGALHAPCGDFARTSDLIDERADARDVDLDAVPGLQRDVVGRHQARPGEQDGPPRHRVVAREIAHELGERPAHARGR